MQGADVALFYHVGHDAQVAAKNCLVPGAANPTKDAQLDLQMVDTSAVPHEIDGAATKLNIVLLDRRRNSPSGGPKG
jgi:uncharacterized caspase-like protein